MSAEPAAHTSLALTAESDRSSTGRRNAGSVVRDHAVPFQCINWAPGPTAQALVALVAATALSTLSPVPRFGLGTTTHGEAAMAAWAVVPMPAVTSTTATHHECFRTTTPSSGHRRAYITPLK